MESPKFVAGEALGSCPSKPPDLNLGTTPPVPAVPPEPPPATLSLPYDIPLSSISALPPFLAVSTSPPLQLLQVLNMRSPSLLLLDLVGDMVDFCPISSDPVIYSQMLSVAAICSLIFELSQVENEIDIPLCEDVAYLPQYEDVTSFPPIGVITLATKKPTRDTITTIPLLLTNSHTMLTLSPTGVTAPIHPWLLWMLWKARIILLFENRQMTEAEDWCSAQLQQPKQLPQRKPFRLPCPTNTRMYADAAWTASSHECGMGCSFTDPNMNSLSRDSATRRHVSSALIVECLAVKSALVIAHSMELQHLSVFSYSLSPVSSFHLKELTNELKSILTDIYWLCNVLSHVSLYFVPRLENTVALCNNNNSSPSGA